MPEMLLKEFPEHICPGIDRMIQALYRSIAAAFTCPAGNTQHRYSPGHPQHPEDHPAQLAQRRFRKVRLNGL